MATNYAIADVFRNLRGRVLALDPATVGLAPGGGRRLWGLLVEIGFPEAVASLVVIADGTVSMYFSNGGGMIGIGEHEAPRRAGEAFLAFAPAFLPHAKPAREFPLPAPGFVRFYFLTFDGILTAEAPGEDLQSKRGPLAPLFYKAHEVITQARLADERRKAGEAPRAPAAGAGDLRLVQAAASGQIKAVRLLLGEGVDPNGADPSGLTPLMAAAYSGHDEIVKALLASRAALEARDASGYTALMFACNGGRTRCVEVLLQRGADVQARDVQESTPLMFAAQHGHNEIVKLLLARGADPSAQGRHGLSAIGFARQNGLAETERILRGAAS
jgi:hypothetical protein